MNIIFCKTPCFTVHLQSNTVLCFTEIFNLPHWIGMLSSFHSFLSIYRHGKYVVKQLKSPRKHTFFLRTPYKFPCFLVCPCLSETRIFAKNSLWGSEEEEKDREKEKGEEKVNEKQKGKKEKQMEEKKEKGRIGGGQEGD